MTSIVVWSGVDTHGVSSLNIATDSRITWPLWNDGRIVRQTHWDHGKKVFASIRMPFIFGFTGDVQFPLHAIPLVIDRIDRGFIGGTTLADIDQIIQTIRVLWKNYPSEFHNDQSIYIGYRLGEGTDAPFELVHLVQRRGVGWVSSRLPVPTDASKPIVVAGSGRQSVERRLELWGMSSAAGTSRAVFSAFAESVVSGEDRASGGAPQLGSLYRIGPGRLLGIIHKERRFFSGVDLTGQEALTGVEWRNSLFERMDGKKKKRAFGAQVHFPR